MKQIIIIGFILTSLLLMGCSSSMMTGGTTAVDATDGTASVTTTSDSGTKTTTVKTTDDSGTTTTVKATGGVGTDWCQPGAQWSATTTGAQAGSAKMVIKGPINSGKYAGLCHVVYDVSSASDTVNMEYYFSKDGKSGYMVADINGQKIEQVWNG